MTQPDTRNLVAKYKIAAPTALDSKDTVMVIEDQTDLRLIICHHLQKLAFRDIKQASNGYEAIEMIKAQKLKIGFYVCDHEMPTMNGIDFLSELRESADLDRAPFCLMMDNPSKEKLMLAVEHGVEEIMVKPFTFNDFLPKLKSMHAKFHNPANPEKLYELAKRCIREDKLDLAVQLYRDLAASAPNAARPLVGLARIDAKRKKYTEALAALGEGETKNPNYVHVYVERGHISATQGNWPTAIASFKKAIELSPLNAIRYHEVAKILFREKRYEEACTLLEGALGHNLNFPALFHFLSQAKFALRDYKAAMRFVRQALATDAENVDYLNQLGICLKETGQVDEAGKVYNQVIKLDPQNRNALYNKAVLLHLKGDVDEAIKLLDRVVRRNPDFTAAKNKIEEYKKEAESASKPAAPAA